ncbi:hydroxymethylpyrimidine/phosphomethylpyrimidine kinase [Gemmobacter aquatilis]|uniref:hydroxymethylpyrimidine kinase n=1 Tax=Gemmobacter aquatilis TaxID=933059 RepID=A0A1H7Y7W5_9RHOB|nr:hydroxymethylpyrimidine/phosphomethylpyrimidine kinase [Gemmobacter aquatilis]SEM42001.1 hydroxymethylpyrimidine/phosphomethylpyrimidine kinase [Gemmobacter aquatilis]
MSVLVIAGLDSSAGAGLARDLAVLAGHGIAARVAATAVTAQDAGGGCCVHPIPAAMVAAQIRAAGPVRAAKLGMLATAEIVAAVAETLPDVPFVLDPVLATSAGAVLLDDGGRAAMIARLIPRAALLTPNLPEAALLTGLAPGASLAELAAGVFARGAQAVLLKGGHAEGPEAVDWLWCPGRAPLRFAAPRRAGSRRGTGCTLASAIAAHLAQGADLPTACARAKRHLDTWWGAGP